MAGFSELVRSLKDAELTRVSRSSVVMLDYWRDPPTRLAELLILLGIQMSEDVELHFEYATPVQSGRGKPSFSDLLIRDANTAVVIEAKFTEPRYESVRDWLARDTGANRRNVLGGWLSSISRITGREIPQQSVHDLPYQLIHRTASACCIDRTDKVLVYQLFGYADAGHYLADLKAFARVSDLIPHVRCNAITCSAELIAARWAVPENATDSNEMGPARLRQELISKPLYRFGQPVVHDVT